MYSAQENFATPIFQFFPGVQLKVLCFEQSFLKKASRVKICHKRYLLADILEVASKLQTSAFLQGYHRILH